MTGQEIKSMILESGVKLWEVAELWGLSDGNFSRRLRKPFNDNEVNRIKEIIRKLNKIKGGRR